MDRKYWGLLNKVSNDVTIIRLVARINTTPMLTKVLVIKYLTTEKLEQNEDSDELFNHLKASNMYVRYPWLKEANIYAAILQQGVMDYFVRTFAPSLLLSRY